MLSDQQKTDIRRFCGYPAYGNSANGTLGCRFFTAYGALEYRMNNMSHAEELVAIGYLSTLNQLETAVPFSSENLDTDEAGNWSHNRSEVADRMRLLSGWAHRLCGFLGVPPGPGLGDGGLSWIV